MGCIPSKSSSSRNHAQRARRKVALREWRSETPLTVQDLARKRQEFWETQPYYGGDKGIQITIPFRTKMLLLCSGLGDLGGHSQCWHGDEACLHWDCWFDRWIWWPDSILWPERCILIHSFYVSFYPRLSIWVASLCAVRAIESDSRNWRSRGSWASINLRECKGLSF